MEEILHQLTGSLSDYVQGFKYTWWWRISSILLENLDTFEVGPPKIVATGVPKDIGTAGAAAMALKKDSLGVLPLKITIHLEWHHLSESIIISDKTAPTFCDQVGDSQKKSLDFETQKSSRCKIQNSKT